MQIASGAMPTSPPKGTGNPAEKLDQEISQIVPQIRTLMDFAAWIVLTGSHKTLLQNGSRSTAFLAEEMSYLPDAVKRTKVSTAPLRCMVCHLS